MRLAFKALSALLLVVAFACGALYARYAMPRPAGEVGAGADRLAERIQAAAEVGAWSETGAVAWTFGGRNEHLWDRARGLARVRWGSAEVLLELGTRRGVARRGAALVTDHAERSKLLEQAYAAWVNDSFWLNPLAKLFDEGAVRAVVERPGGDPGATALLVTYTAGGLTPGDSYLWVLEPGSDLPAAARLWVSVLPLPGLPVTWSAWTRLESGARVATRHELPLGFVLELTDVRGARTLTALTGGGVDPFAPLLLALDRSTVD